MTPSAITRCHREASDPRKAFLGCSDAELKRHDAVSLGGKHEPKPVILPVAVAVVVVVVIVVIPGRISRPYFLIFRAHSVAPDANGHQWIVVPVSRVLVTVRHQPVVLKTEEILLPMITALVVGSAHPHHAGVIP